MFALLNRDLNLGVYLHRLKSWSHAQDTSSKSCLQPRFAIHAYLLHLSHIRVVFETHVYLFLGIG